VQRVKRFLSGALVFALMLSSFPLALAGEAQTDYVAYEIGGENAPLWGGAGDFTIELSENSGSLERGWTPYSYYTGSSTGPVSTSWEYVDTLEPDDPAVNLYQNSSDWKVEAITEPIYGTQLVQVGTRTETIQLGKNPSMWTIAAHMAAGYEVTKQYTTESYQSWEKVGTEEVWVPGYWEEYTYTDYEYVSSTTFSWLAALLNVLGYKVEWTGSLYKVYKPVQRTGTRWVEGHYETRDVYDWVTRYRRVFTGYTAMREVPIYEEQRIQVGTRTTGYRIYRARYSQTTYYHYRTDYSLKPWGSLSTTITLSAIDGYSGTVTLSAEAGDPGIEVHLADEVLRVGSSASTTLTIAPSESVGGSPHLVTITASDAFGRVKQATYELDLTVLPKPSLYTWSRRSTRTWSGSVIQKPVYVKIEVSGAGPNTMLLPASRKSEVTLSVTSNYPTSLRVGISPPSNGWVGAWLDRYYIPSGTSTITLTCEADDPMPSRYLGTYTVVVATNRDETLATVILEVVQKKPEGITGIF
jgi:hypothetical protein